MQQRNIILAILISGVLVATALAGTSKPQETVAIAESKQTEDTQVGVTPAEKIEVVHFHGTQQCWSCKTIGEFALKTITEKFPEEYKNGTIVFKDINGELSENRDIVMKYQAVGSSLYVNAIRSGTDNIKQDTTVWRLVSNEQQFTNYFESKLKTLLDIQ
jgi:hypothetical protein